MFGQIATFLVDTVVTFIVFLLLARFLLQWLRVPFRNPVGEFLLATTDWVVAPARRLVPGGAPARRPSRSWRGGIRPPGCGTGRAAIAEESARAAGTR